jgi:ADP-heptose:LPS heptosyltransferase
MYRRLLWPGGFVWIGDRGNGGPRHAYDRHVAMLRQAGIRSVPPPDVSRFGGDTARFGLPQSYVLLVPGAAPHRPAKRWPAERYGELASLLAQRSIAPVVLGANGDAAVFQAMSRVCPAAIDLTGQTSLFDIPALARNAVAAVGNDTGPMHLIAAAGCSSVVLFSGASDPAQSAPIGSNVTVLQRTDLAQLSAAEVAAALDAAARSSMTSASSKAAALSPNSRA